MLTGAKCDAGESCNAVDGGRQSGIVRSAASRLSRELCSEGPTRTNRLQQPAVCEGHIGAFKHRNEA